MMHIIGVIIGDFLVMYLLIGFLLGVLVELARPTLRGLQRSFSFREVFFTMLDWPVNLRYLIITMHAKWKNS
jgi:hypothetical protein